MTTKAMPISIACPSRPFRRASRSTFSRTRCETGPGPDRLEALFGRAVEGDPERVQPLAKEAVDEGVVEERRVGRHLGPQAQGLDGLDHVEDRRVDGRLAEAAEHDGSRDEGSGRAARRAGRTSPRSCRRRAPPRCCGCRSGRRDCSARSARWYRRFRLWMFGRISARPFFSTISRREPGARPSFFSSPAGTTRRPSSTRSSQASLAPLLRDGAGPFSPFSR